MLDDLEKASPPGRRSRLRGPAGLASNRASRLTGGAGAVAAGVGLAAWALGAGFLALWCFAIAAVAIALVLPMPMALVSPLFMGLIGWLVDMLPFVILAGWAAVSARWALGLLRERRWPRGGRWVWLVGGLAAWTTLGVVSITSADFKHFLLLLGVQALTSAVLLAVVDCAAEFEDRLRIATALVIFVLILSAGVLLQFVGVPVQSLQDDEIAGRVEEAYGLDAFPNNLEMIKYGLSSKAGAREFRAKLGRFSAAHPDVPEYEAFLPKFRAFENNILVRFEGSARPIEDELNQAGIQLIYDNVGITPANTVPRMRSFARNSLTYAGVCVVLLPICFFLAWKGGGRRRLIGRLGVVSCLFGAGFSLVRGSWIAILIGIIYLLVDGWISWRQKTEVLIAYLLGALVLVGFFLARYDVDPLGARALAQGSVTTRASVYQDTVESLTGIQVLFGFGTEQPRTESGSSHVAGRYVPDAGTHSTYLNFLFRAGVPGALGIIAVYMGAALHARAASRRKSGDERIFAAMLAFSIVAAAAHAVILNLFTEPIYTLTVSLVLAMAVAGATNLGASVWPWRTRSDPR